MLKHHINKQMKTNQKNSTPIIEEKTGIDRRTFMGYSAAGIIAAGLSGISSCTTKESAAPTNEVVATASNAVKKEYAKYYFPYHKKPATVLDFGLTPEQEDRAKALHASLYVFDFEPEVDWYEGLFDNFLSGGARGVGGSFTIDAVNWGKVHGYEDPADFEVTKEDWWTRGNMDDNIAFIKELEKGGKCMICLNSADLEKAAKAGKVAMMLDAQHGYFIGNQLDRLNEYYDKGLRRVQLSYNRASMLATGCMDPRDGGVTTFGKEAIARMNEIGILVDTGHCSSFTLLDAIDVSSKPIACSHAGLRSISPRNPRTHNDEGLKKLADNGGVFGVVGSPGTMGEDMPQAADVKDFIRCIDYAVNLMGEDHVGFALDQVQAPSFKEFLTSPDWPAEAVASVNVEYWPWSDIFKGMENQSGYPNLTRGMVALGYSDEKITKIMGGNHMRLVKEVIG